MRSYETRVPTDIGSCPTCGAQLMAHIDGWESATGRPTEVGTHTWCTRACDARGEAWPPLRRRVWRWLVASGYVVNGGLTGAPGSDAALAHGGVVARAAVVCTCLVDGRTRCAVHGGK